ncbi:MAG: replicative DNA helicase [Bacteroidales bacterium]|nr:replicative DNA helicase [Candidatus Cryptobacteroides caccocaballi]
MAKTYRGKSSRVEQVNLDVLMGTTPPQAIDFEEAVLGALMVEPNCLDDTLDELSNSNCFYSQKNRLVFDAIKDLYTQHAPVDSYTVAEKLRSTGKLEEAGGLEFISDLASRVGSAAHVEYYAKVIKQKFIQRELITASYSILKTAYDDSVNMEALIDTAETKIFAAVEHNVTKDAQDIGSVINKSLNDLEKAQSQEGSYSGVPSGFPSIDSITLGWQPSDLIILAARPSVGKTAFALNVARNAAVMGYPTAIFSLEMPAKQLANRMMVSETGIDSKKLKGGVKLEPGDWERLESQLTKLASAQLYIDDTPSLPVMEFRSKVKKLVKQKGVRLIIVDYLQLMQGPVELRGMREQEVAAISRTLKATAKEHGVPIIALSQLSRQAVTRQGSNNRPQLSDLRESGSIEQDADMVLFIHRLDYQNFGDDTVQKGETQLIIAKHRNGEIGDVPLIFRDSMAKFVDAQEENLSNDFGHISASAMNSAPAGDTGYNPFGGDDFGFDGGNFA